MSEEKKKPHIKPLYDDTYFDALEALESESVLELPIGEYVSLADYQKLESALSIARKALMFYGSATNKKISESKMGDFTPFLLDRGMKARDALEEIDKLMGEA